MKFLVLGLVSSLSLAAAAEAQSTYYPSVGLYGTTITAYPDNWQGYTPNQAPATPYYRQQQAYPYAAPQSPYYSQQQSHPNVQQRAPYKHRARDSVRSNPNPDHYVQRQGGYVQGRQGYLPQASGYQVVHPRDRFVQAPGTPPPYWGRDIPPYVYPYVNNQVHPGDYRRLKIVRPYNPYVPSER